MFAGNWRQSVRVFDRAVVGHNREDAVVDGARFLLKFRFAFFGPLLGGAAGSVGKIGLFGVGFLGIGGRLGGLSWRWRFRLLRDGIKTKYTGYGAR